jgi:hypothetical protein
MSIRHNAYDLCKTVWSSPVRETIQTTIRNLSMATDEQIRTSNNRSGIGYAARPYRAQLLGYLFVDREKERLAENYPPLRGTLGLTEGERGILTQAQKQVEALDKRCVSKLTEAVPECSLAINPYSRFNYEIPEGTDDVQLYDEQLAQILFESFHLHPAISIALESRKSFKAIVPENKRQSTLDIAKTVLNLEQSLLAAGPLLAPRRLFELLITQPPGTANEALLDYICALTCIKASLDTLNELLYQAILTNKLPVLDNDSIIEFGNIVGTSVSKGFTVKYQPTEKSGLGNFGLVLVKAKISNQELDLGRIETAEVQLSGEFGDSVRVTVREIDEHLNPYGQLLPQHK